MKFVSKMAFHNMQYCVATALLLLRAAYGNAGKGEVARLEYFTITKGAKFAACQVVNKVSCGCTNSS